MNTTEELSKIKLYFTVPLGTPLTVKSSERNRKV